VQPPHFLNLPCERLDESSRQGRRAVIVSFAFPHHDLSPRKVQVLHSQPACFHQSQARAIHQSCHQTEGAQRNRSQDQTNFLNAQHDGQTLPAPGAHGVEPHFALQDLGVQKQDRGQRLILRAGGHVFLDRQMGQELVNLGRPQLVGMPPTSGLAALEAEELFNPLAIVVFGPQRHVQRAGAVANLLQQRGGREAYLLHRATLTSA